MENETNDDETIARLLQLQFDEEAKEIQPRDDRGSISTTFKSKFQDFMAFVRNEQENETQSDDVMMKLRDRRASGVSRMFNKFFKDFQIREFTIAQRVKMVKEFLVCLKSQVDICEVFNHKEEELEELKRTLFIRIHPIVYSPKYTDDAEQDSVLSRKVFMYQFVELHHLDSKINFDKVQGDLSIYHLHNINCLYSPNEKIQSIHLSARHINMGLDSTCAENFLVCLVYLLIKANIPNLCSNINFMDRYHDVINSEKEYYFTVFKAAVEFIKKMDFKDLQISQEEYNLFLDKRNVEFY